MKLAILLMNAGRGSGEVARQHARHLVSRGHEVFFLHPGMGEGVPGARNLDIELHSEILPVHEYLPSAGAGQKAVSRMSREEAFAYLPAYEEALEAVAGETDLFLGHHANLSAIASSRVALRRGRPYVLFLHGTGIEPRHAGHYDDEVWAEIAGAVRRADGLLVTTEYVRDALVRPLVQVPEERFLVLPCGIDLEEFHPENQEGIKELYEMPETYVVCPGALTAIKGPQNVVEASRRYAGRAPTIFLGEGELREELEAKLGGRGRFLGFVPGPHKARLINAASLLTAAPDKKEHFGIIYAEALAGGTPPVAWEGGGVSSIVTPEVGVLTERTPEALGQALEDLLEDSGRRARLGRAARARAEALFAKDRLGERLESWLERILQG